jgi:rhamnose transport system permease protein
MSGMNGTNNMKRKTFREIGLLIFLVALCAFFQMLNNNFLTLENISDMLRNASILGILSVGMMMVLLTGGIDLSIGALLALSGMASSLIVRNNPELNIIFAILAGIGLGAACGLLNGLLVAKGKIIPIIATLGTMNVFRGTTYLISDGAWVSAHQMTKEFKAISTSSVGFVSTLFIIAVIIIVLAYFFLTYTRTGRYIYAVGSNPGNVHLTGIKKDKILFLVYILMGVLASLSGILWVSKFASAQGDTATGYEMTVIAACVLGGVSVSGGSGKISGLILGILLLGVLQNALPLVNVSTFWEDFIEGMIILIAIMLNVFIKRRADRNALCRREI